MKTKEAAIKSAKGIYTAIPILVGVILLISLANSFIPKETYKIIFTGSFIDPIIGSFIGSILAGSPITSYIIGGELLAQGVSLIAIIAFIVAWVTVGIIQFPAEAMLLGKKFALVRNIVSFFISIAVAITTVLIMGIL